MFPGAPQLPIGVVPVEELTGGLNEWRNIQEIVRLTFKALHDVVRAQGESIKKLEIAAEHSATKAELESISSTKATTTDLSCALAELSSDLQSALSAKANLNDVTRTLSDHSRALGTKANAADLNVAMESKASRLDIQHILDGRMANAADVHALVEENSALMARIDMMERNMEAMRLEISKKADNSTMRDELGTKATVADVSSALSTKANVADVEENLQGKASRSAVAAALQKRARIQDMDAALSVKADLEEVNGLVANKVDHSALVAALSDKCSNIELSERCAAVEHRAGADIRRVEDEITAQSQNHAGELASLKDELEAFMREMDSKLTDITQHSATLANKHEVAEELATRITTADAHALAATSVAPKADIAHVDMIENQFQNALQNYMVSSEICELLSHRAPLNETGELRARQDVLLRSTQELSSAISTISTKMAEAIGDETMAQKADKTQVLALVEEKQSFHVQQLEAAVAKLSEDIDTKASVADHSVGLSEQQSLNHTIFTELSVGRWIWNSRKTKEGGLVPWNVQTVNTQPENFVWKKGSTRIVTVAPGLYEVHFGFFTKKKPTVQLLLNGDPCLSAVNSASHLLHHSSSRLANVQHPAGNVTGLTLVDFLALPAKAKLSIAYAGDGNAEGFISLRKL